MRSGTSLTSEMWKRLSISPILASCGPGNHAWVVAETIRDPASGQTVPLRLTCPECGTSRKVDVGDPDPVHAHLPAHDSEVRLPRTAVFAPGRASRSRQADLRCMRTGSATWDRLARLDQNNRFPRQFASFQAVLGLKRAFSWQIADLQQSGNRGRTTRRYPLISALCRVTVR
jgi:hypothetical protein